MRTTATRAALGLSAVLLATACGGSNQKADESPGGTPAITVDATDTACILSKTTAPSGAIGFVITNKGSKVTEFYVYGPGDQIVAEKENIGPGLTQKMSVEISKPGTYVTACKPGMQGNGIRGELKVTGKSTSANAAIPALSTATASYKDYVDGQTDLLPVERRSAQGTAAVVSQLLADVKQVVARAKKLTYNPLQLANGSKGLLDEMATGNVTGEEERYSHTDLYDFSANFDGAKAALTLLGPVIQKHDPALARSLADKQKKMAALIAKHRHGATFDGYTSLGKTEVKQLSDALDAYSEQVAKVAGVIAQQ